MAKGGTGKPRGDRDLIVWQKAMVLSKPTDELTRRFPREERFGLVAQMRRAAVSIPSNPAEGQVHRTTGECIRFISHADSSAAEPDTQVRLSIDLGFATRDSSQGSLSLIAELRRMLNALRRSLR